MAKADQLALDSTGWAAAAEPYSAQMNRRCKRRISG
jgi:hypothetical protein